MRVTYFLLNNVVFIFHPDTHEVFQVGPKRIERVDRPEEMMALRLRAVEITRQQAERLVPFLEFLLFHSS